MSVTTHKSEMREALGKELRRQAKALATMPHFLDAIGSATEARRALRCHAQDLRMMARRASTLARRAA